MFQDFTSINMFFVNSLILLCASITLGGINIERGGWLDRLVHYHKYRLFDELKNIPPVNVKASVGRAPVGYVDTGSWDLEAVLRVMALLRQSGAAGPVLRYLRRSMPRRRFMKYADTFLVFPSLALSQPNDFYYDVGPNEFDDEDNAWGAGEVTDESIIVVSNPTEARLPSAQISVKLLKEILEARAVAARYIPTTKQVIMWKPMPKTTKSDEAPPAPGGGNGKDDTIPDGGESGNGTAGSDTTAAPTN